MNLQKQPGGHVWVAEAPNWTGSDAPHLNIGIHPQTIIFDAGHGLSWKLGQMYGVLGPGLIMAQHVFRGLKRRMYVGEDKNAAAKNLVATWAPLRDAQLVGDRFNSVLQYVVAPTGRVFAVYIVPNEMLTEFPDIYGWTEHWAWIAADPDMPGAPIDWKTRYDAKVWSRST